MVTLAHKLPSWFRHPCPEDVHVSEDVFERNEYRLPESFAATDVILDLGGHAGSFALACLERGAGRVFCVEPWPANAALLRENTRWYRQQVHVVEAACWRSDKTGWKLFLDFPGLPLGQGGRSVVGTRSGLMVETIALDQLIDRAGGKVRLLKCDAEGAEWVFLSTSKSLRSCGYICGEYHCPGHGSVAEEFLLSQGIDPSIGWLEKVITASGFDFAYEQDEPKRGHFWSKRLE